MPTQKKADDIQDLKKLIDESTIAIATTSSGMTVDNVTRLRTALRGKGVQYRVVKNTLAYIAADQAGKPQLREVVKGPTGIVFGFDDPAVPAKTLTEFLAAARIQMPILGAVLGNDILTSAQVDELAKLPPKDELVAKLLGQMMAPITSLAYVLNAPVGALARALQAVADQQGSPAEAAEPVAEPAA